MALSLLPLVVALAAAAPAAPGAAPEAEFDHAMQLLENFDDVQAAAAFRKLLAESPPGAIAAKAHLYLGLIAFNDINPDEARAEFRRAIEANPAIELPREASPKARLAFGEVLRDFSREMVRPRAAPAPSPAPVVAAPPAATAVAPSWDATPPASSSSHVVSYVLIGTAVVLVGLAIYGGAEVASYNSMIGAGNSAAFSANVPYSYDQISSARGQASFWAVGWPVAAGLAAAGGVGSALAW